MKKAIGIGVVVGAVVVALAAVGVVWWNQSQGEEPESGSGVSAEQTDGEKFKEEYEKLNGTTRESDGATYNEVSIKAQNPIKYVDCAEALEVLDKPEAVLYVGAEWCPWCRNAVPVLLEVAESFGTRELYYLNLDAEKSTFEVKDGELVQTKRGSEDYYKLLDKLSSQLKDYVLTKDGKKYPTGEKRIYMPDVYGIKDGQIVARKSGTVSLDEGQTKYSPLTAAQKKTLRQDYQSLFKAVYGDVMQPCESDEETCG